MAVKGFPIKKEDLIMSTTHIAKDLGLTPNAKAREKVANTVFE